MATLCILKATKAEPMFVDIDGAKTATLCRKGWKCHMCGCSTVATSSCFFSVVANGNWKLVCGECARKKPLTEPVFGQEAATKLQNACRR